MTGLLDSFLYRAALAGIGLAIAAAPLGSFVVWRRMAFFGDAIAHAAILGVALSLASGLSIFAGVLFVALLMALFISWRNSTHSVDTTLGVAAHGTLALGLVAVSFIEGVRIDIEAFLFGDILAVSRGDLAVIWGGAVLVVALLAWRWQALLTATLNEELAAAAGINPRREEIVLIFALAVVVAVAIKVVGALLISSMLIIPAAAARPLARTPEKMALIAVGIGMLAVLGGLTAAWHLDTPAGPSIVTTAAVIFVLSALFRK
ncbi:MAG: metal ABC transporter permease [Silicimonas sp.]|nr:metal ABC transporter permease [Silicimonas sp.]